MLLRKAVFKAQFSIWEAIGMCTVALMANDGHYTAAAITALFFGLISAIEEQPR